MPTLTVTQFTTSPFITSTFPSFTSAVTVQSVSPTEIVGVNSFDPTLVTTIVGTGFTYDSAGNPTGGTVTNVNFTFNPSGGPVSSIAAMSGASFDLVDLFAALGDPAATAALIADYDVVFDATLSVGIEPFFIGAGTPFGDTAIAGNGGSYMELGTFADTYIAGSGFDQISFASEVGTAGVVANLTTGFITDTYGNVETVSGQFESLRGSLNDDSLTGDGVRQHLRGLAGDDTLDGAGGVDLVRYDRDANYGGAAGVTVNLATGSATDGFGDTDVLLNIEDVRGTVSNDFITGDAGNNRLESFGSDDIVNGGDGSDTINGGDGNDTINPGDNSGFDLLIGSAGSDVYDFADANPFDARYDITYGGWSSALIFTIDGVNNTGSINKGNATSDTLLNINNALVSATGGFGLVGGDLSDTFNITHDSAANHWTQVTGAEGHDIINITGGFVRANYNASPSGIIADLGTGLIQDGLGFTDTITGDLGELQGSNSADVMTGSASNESFIGRMGADTIDGQGGFDRVRYDRSGVTEVIVDFDTGVATGTWEGTDFVHSLSNIEWVRGSRTDDSVLLGSAEDERFDGYGGNDFFNGRAGDDYISGRDGYDTASYQDATAGVAVYLQLGAQNVGGGQGRDTLDGIEGLVGSDHDDRLVGTSELNILQGGDGNDILRGKGGDDSFFGGEGNDNMRGDAGLDFFEGGTGNDIMVGLNGADTLDGQDGNDSLFGGRGNDDMYGGEGDDVMRGNLNNDFMVGDGGSDRMFGGGQNDTLIGGAGRDFLLGENGNDSLDGFSGDDNLTGGAGADEFRMSIGYGYDRILDFEHGSDVINIANFGITDMLGINPIASQISAGVRIAFGGGDTLLLVGDSLGNLDSSDFIFA